MTILLFAILTYGYTVVLSKKLFEAAMRRQTPGRYILADEVAAWALSIFGPISLFVAVLFRLNFWLSEHINIDWNRQL